MKAVVGPTRLFLRLVEEFGDRYAAAKDGPFGHWILPTWSARRSTCWTRAACNPVEIARQYQSQFRHVLVDEFQDINEVQDRLLRLISRETAGDDSRPNLFAVGDVKQSIYRFRLAEPGQFVARLWEVEHERPAAPAADRPQHQLPQPRACPGRGQCDVRPADERRGRPGDRLRRPPRTASQRRLRAGRTRRLHRRAGGGPGVGGAQWGAMGHFWKKRPG